MGGYDFKVEGGVDNVGKKAQATLFIIVVIVLLLLSSIYIYLAKSAATKQITQQTHKTYTTLDQIKPIADYMNECVSALSREALEKIGMQGGTLYVKQGGVTPDIEDTFNGAFFIIYQGNKVSYGISSQQVMIPNYPSLQTPYGPNSGNDPVLSGVNSLKLLNGSGSALQHQLEQYVLNQIDTCFAQNLFEDQGYDFVKGQKSISVVFGSSSVIVTLNYPLAITNNLTQEKSEMDTFSVKHNIHFNEIYTTLAYLINKDITDLTFNLSKPSGLSDGISTRVVKNAFLREEDDRNGDDIIQIVDQNSLLGGKPYTFQFARKNRNPALHYFPINSYSLPQTTSSEGDVILPSVEFNDIPSPHADDPDEDDVSFAYYISNKIYDDGTPEGAMPELTESTPQIIDTPEGSLTVRIVASDGKFKDYQEITFVKVSP